MNKQSTRIEWVDISKGIGIILVVAGHVFQEQSRYIYWFHIPLFFFLSGYLYNPQIDFRSYLKKKVRSLLVPYFSFLISLSIPDLVNYYMLVKFKATSFSDSILPFIIRQLTGGRELYGWFDVFWFITCLFLCQQVFHFLNRGKVNRPAIISAIVVCLYCFTIAQTYFPSIQLPLFWSLNIVPMALVFMSIGSAVSDKMLFNRVVLMNSIILFGLLIVLHRQGIAMHEFNMKWEVYGMPGVNLVAAISGIVIVCNMARLLLLARYLKTLFSELGKASIIIMFLHQTIRQLVFDHVFAIQNEYLILAVTLIVCYCFYLFFSQYHLFRLLFLGETKVVNVSN